MLDKKEKLKISSYNLEPKNPFLKKLLFVMIPLAVLASIAGFIFYSKSSSRDESKIGTGVAEEKARILSRVNISQAGDKPLSDEEKSEIYNKLSGSKIQDFNFSREEEIKLLNALNGTDIKQ